MGLLWMNIVGLVDIERESSTLIFFFKNYEFCHCGVTPGAALPYSWFKPVQNTTVGITS